MTDTNHIIRVACTEEGHEDDWIEFDTSGWTLLDYRRLFYSSYADGLSQWIEKDSTAWHLTGADNTIVLHPGRGAAQDKWFAAYQQLGREGFVIGRWLGMSPWIAAQERMTAQKKSSVGSAEDGEG